MGWWRAALGALGVLLAVGGGAMALLWPSAFRHLLQTELSLSPSSTSFRMWKQPPVPIFIEFYFFNWTNPEALREPGRRPELVECGPYVFREVHEKTDLQWHGNATVSYWRARRWFFAGDRSGGALSDRITTLNVVALTAAFHTRHWNFFLQKSLSLSMTTLGQQLHEAHTVGELLFEGFESPLMTMAQTVPGLADIDIPFDRFGWFYQRNGSVEHDGRFTVHTGADDLALLGRLSRWNGAARTRFFDGACGLVNGSAGELFPPGRRRGGAVAMFSPDLCRSIEYRYERDVEVQGVSGLQYVAGAELLANRETCFCSAGAGACAPAGALDVSTCRLGAPAFVSFPHFHLADPSYLRQVHGLLPDARRHANFLVLEPTTGIPLDVAARFQINILLQSYPSIALFQDVPKIYFPMVWFQERVTMTPELVNSLKMLLLLPSGGVVIATVLAVIGATIIAVTVLNWMKPTLSWQLDFPNCEIPLKTPAQEYAKYPKSEVESELLQLHRQSNE